MPGIVGLITKLPRQSAEPQLHRMVESIRHESFYTTGTCVDESLGVYLGWTAREHSFSDGMPLTNERADVVLVFAGEEYPEPTWKARLKENGHEFGQAGPSYLIHAYEEDAAFPRGLNGRFHGLLADRSRRMAMLFNDRYGIGRLYYHESKHAFYFAAEAKAILVVRPELRSISARSLGELVSCGCVLDNRTLFDGISVLPAASAWIFRDGRLEEKNSYFQPKEWEDQPALEPEAYYWELRDAFAGNLPRYFNGSERVGISLTGGLDSRMIMAWCDAAPGSLPCYTFGGTFRDCQDVILARQVAQACAQPFDVIPIGQEFLSQFPRHAERAVYLTDGCVGVRSASDLYANEIAAKIAPVRMTGNYGSEILRRLRAFKPAEPLAGIFDGEFSSYVRAARETFAAQQTGHALSFIAFKQTPWHHYGLLALEQTQLSLRSPYLDNRLVQTAFRAPGAGAVKTKLFEEEDATDCVRLIKDGNPELEKIRTDRGVAGDSSGLSAALTRGLLEFSFKAEYAYDSGMQPWVARIDHFLAPLRLERLFLGRHKFNHYRVWYRDSLSSYVRDILLDSRTLSRPFLRRTGVEAAVRGHLYGGQNHTTEIHQLLTLELIHRLFVDGK